MPEIKITYPKIEINLIEIDDYIPSFKISMYHHNQGMGYENSYYYEFWIKTEDWDTFIDNLKEKSATLLDMSGNKKIIVNKNIISLFFSKKGDSLTFNSKCTFIFSENEMGNIIIAFLLFPKWW